MSPLFGTTVGTGGDAIGLSAAPPAPTPGAANFDLQMLSNLLASSGAGPAPVRGSVLRFVAWAANVREDDAARLVDVLRGLCEGGLSMEFVWEQVIGSTPKPQIVPPQQQQQQLQHQFLQIQQQHTLFNLSNVMTPVVEGMEDRQQQSEVEDNEDCDSDPSEPEHSHDSGSCSRDDSEHDDDDDEEEELADPNVDILQVQKNPETGLFHCPYRLCKYDGAVRRYNLKVHYATHLGDLSRTAKCSQCKMAFRRRYDLDRHGVNVHGMSPKEALANGGPRVFKRNQEGAERMLISRLERLIESRNMMDKRRRVKRENTAPVEVVKRGRGRPRKVVKVHCVDDEEGFDGVEGMEVEAEEEAQPTTMGSKRARSGVETRMSKRRRV
ncbi:hypothetical protein HK101_000746 [Irineochytrium annulatum]|nr:hypothetical protein HK101_000746 [Irineochytrium annulatum]